MFKNILVVNDIPGAGKVAANINVPILNAAGLETAILPTVILSTQTGGTYDHIVRHEMGEDFNKMLQHWEDNDIEFESFLTGYFSNEDQVETFRDYYQRVKERNSQAVLMIDPIMADNGIYYDGFDQGIAQKFSALIPFADLILPNITEACFITETPYKEYFSIEELENMSDKFLEQGCRYSVITGIRFPEECPDQIGFYVKGQDLPGQWVAHRYYPEYYFGTGDVVFSSIAAMYSCDYPIIEALKETGQIIEEVIEATINLNRNSRFGLYFEGSLHHFTKMKEENK